MNIATSNINTQLGRPLQIDILLPKKFAFKFVKQEETAQNNSEESEEEQEKYNGKRSK